MLPDGVWMLLASFLIVIFTTLFGAIYTYKNKDTDDSKKNILLLTVGSTAFVLTIGYIVSVKNSANVDLVLSWFILTIGLLFTTGVLFFIGSILPKLNANGE